MNPRDRWETLQARIGAARAALDTGDPARALQEIESALAVDPGFLAAQSLRDRILSGSAPSAARLHGAAASSPGSQTSGEYAAQPPIVSAERYARFEERARRRRVDRRLDAARAALAAHRLREASAALEEIAELDPNLPELVPLAQQLESIRQRSSGSRVGAWFTAALVFGTIILGASWVEESRVLFSRPVAGVGPLVSVEVRDAIPPVDSAGASPPLDSVAAGPIDSAPPAEQMGANAPRTADAGIVPAVRNVRPAPTVTSTNVPQSAAAAAAPPAAPVAAVVAPPPPPVRPAMPPPGDPASVLPQAVVPPPVSRLGSSSTPRVSPEPPAVSSAATPLTPPMPSVPPVDDEALVKQTLQRYRAAYEELDARSAQAVWPAVNESALARAFDGLESQQLTFDACTVQLGGNRAAATCRGKARYVPKVGSRDPRVEPRVWTFALHKAGDEWKIDAARAER